MAIVDLPRPYPLGEEQGAQLARIIGRMLIHEALKALDSELRLLNTRVHGDTTNEANHDDTEASPRP